MPPIPVSTTLGFIGFLFVLVGGFLLLAGLGIVGVEKITVQKGKPTWILGTVLAILGIILVIFSEPLTKDIPLNPESSTKTEITQPSSIDVPDPLGTDVLEFAAVVNFDIEPKGSIKNIGGIWDSEWNYKGGTFYTGTATILVYSDNWITIVYQGDDGGQFLIKAKLVDEKLVGRYINLNSKSDTTPWVGIIVDDNRIDGKWRSGEWNFTRNP